MGKINTPPQPDRGNLLSSMLPCADLAYRVGARDAGTLVIHRIYILADLGECLRESEITRAPPPA